MTLHTKSVVSFGQLLNFVSRTILDGGPVTEVLDHIRTQLDAVAALLIVDDRVRHSETLRYGVAASDGEALDLPTLSERYQFITAHAQRGPDDPRYTLWLFRERASARFDADEGSLSEILVAQLARELDVLSRIGTSETDRMLYSDVLDKISVGVVTLDAAGRVMRVSSVANTFLAKREGLHVQNGRLRANCPREDKALQLAVRSALQDGARDGGLTTRGVSLTKRSGARQLGVVVRPVTVSTPHAAAAVYIRDTEACVEVENDLVRQLFDLTPAEAAVARRLTAGLSLEDAANSLAISRNTARAHLRSIFSKSGITRQTELVRLVLNSAVILGERPQQAA
ncbi:MAG: helix-turn-helix transcriptional regulator [Proteobacteria bacterium]|nr:helix-turn-helix transcriptional regulator [Pseudomonadota bacterium]